MDCSLVFDQDHIDHCRNIIALSIMENCARKPKNYEEDEDDTTDVSIWSAVQGKAIEKRQTREAKQAMNVRPE